MATLIDSPRESVVIPQQDEIKIYPNEGGGITIEQASSLGDQPAVITLHAQHVEVLTQALLRVAGEILDRHEHDARRGA